MLAPFANLTYRYLFVAQVASLLGTGLATVALGLLAYSLAGENAGLVLGTALAIKMIAYVGMAPVVSAYASMLPRRAFLVVLDLVRAGVVLRTRHRPSPCSPLRHRRASSPMADARLTMFDPILTFLIEMQSLINKRVGADLRAFAQTRDWLNLLVVLPLGMLFGAVHALTPGHSKTILASYVAGSGSSVRRAIGIATVLSVTHILTAVLIAVLALPLITRTIVGVGRAPLIEDISRSGDPNPTLFAIDRIRNRRSECRTSRPRSRHYPRLCMP